MGTQVDVTWQIQLNDPCTAVMQTVVTCFTHMLFVGAVQEEKDNANYADSNFGLFTKLIC